MTVNGLALALRVAFAKICISFNNNSSAVHERTQVRADISHEVAHLGGGQDRADIAGLIELEKALEEQIKRMKGK